VRVVSGVVGMPDIFSIFTHGKMRQNAIDSQKEFEAKKGKSGGSVSSSEDEKLIEKYRSPRVSVPMDHLDSTKEINSSLKGFMDKHGEEGVDFLVRWVLTKGANVHPDNREAVVRHFVEDFKAKNSKTASDFYSAFCASSSGDKLIDHLSSVPLKDERRNVSEVIMRHPEDFFPHVQWAIKVLSDKPHLL